MSNDLVYNDLDVNPVCYQGGKNIVIKYLHCYLTAYIST